MGFLRYRIPVFLLVILGTLYTGCSQEAPPTWFTLTPRGAELGSGTARIRNIELGWVGEEGEWIPYPFPQEWSCSVEECRSFTAHGPITLSFREEERTSSSLQIITLRFTPGVPWGVAWQLDPREVIAGLGMTMVGLNLKGYRLPMQLEILLSAEGAINEVHLPLYALVSSRGYGIFRRSLAPGWVDLGKLHPDRAYLLSLEATHPVEFVFSSPPEISAYFLRAQGGWTGIPVWALGLFFWRNENRHASEMLEDLYDFKTRGYPLSVLWFDNPWETARNTFIPDPFRIPDLKELITTLNKEGVKFMLWISPHANLPEFEEPPYREDAAELARTVTSLELVVRREDGEPLLAPWGSGFGYLFDFTRPHVRDWLWNRLEPLLRWGVQGWKLDYGEDLIPWVLFPQVSQRPLLAEGDRLTAHAVYKLAYHRTFRELSKRVHGEDIFLLSRTGAFGEVAITHCLWPGDMNNDFSFNELFRDPPGRKPGGLPAVILATLHLNVSGIPCLASDTGGFRGGTPDPELFMRWAAFSAYQPVMQLGGGGEHRPFAATFRSTPADEVIRFFSREHALLAPYLYALVERARRGEALPVYPLLLEGKSSDPYLYRLGEELLVRPVTQPGGEITTELPPGVWVDSFTGKAVQGGVSFSRVLPLDRIGLWQRAGSVILRWKEVPEAFPHNQEEFLRVPLLPYFVPLRGERSETTLDTIFFGTIHLLRTSTEVIAQFPKMISEVALTRAALDCPALLEGREGPLPESGWLVVPAPQGRVRVYCP